MAPRFLQTAVAAVREISTKAATISVSDSGPRFAERSVKSGGMPSLSISASGRDSLGRRLFALVYAKRSSVIAIRKWKEEGHVVKKYELNRIVRELRKFKRYKHALEVCEWMRIQEDMKLVPGDFAVHLDLISKVRGLNSAEKFFEDLPDNMRDYTTCNALLHTYVQNKKSDKAEALMNKMSECGLLKNPVSFNQMLSLCISTGQLEKVPELIQELKKVTSPDVVTYNLWLTACASQNLIETAEKVFTELTKSKVEPDWLTYSTMANIYTKNSLKEQAESTLKEMEKTISGKNRVAYASLISLYTTMDNVNDIFRVWKKMKATYNKLNDVEYTSMIASLLKLKELEEAKKLFAEWESISPTKDPRVPNLLLSYYINGNQMEEAEAVYNRMVQKGFKPCYTTWELLSLGYLKQREIDKVLECFGKAVMSVKKWDPNIVLVRQVFQILEDFGNTAAAEQLVKILRVAGYVSTETYNCLLRTYKKAGKMPLVVAERMKKDKVKMDEETTTLVQETSKMCVSEIPSSF